MVHFDENVFQELIANTRFIRWAKGKEAQDGEYWSQWKSAHPENIKEFDEALKIVQGFSFTPTEITEGEIKYLWQKTSKRFIGLQQSSQIHKLTDYLVKAAAVLFIPLLVYFGWISFNKNNFNSQFVENVTSQYITVVSPIGARTEVDLPDGSKAWLSAASKITYPTVFNGKERKVKLEGEAFFKVQKGEKPFLVENFGPTVKVYGTQFDVNSYQNEQTVTVALVEGKVSLQSGDTERFLRPGQVSFYNRKRHSQIIETENLNRFTSWREGKFIFMDTPLNSILRVLQRQYNVEIDLENPKLGEEKYRFTFQNENIHQIIELLQLSAPLKIVYQKGEILADGTMIKDKIIISGDINRIIKH